MKKSITTLCCMLFAVCCIAQENVLHENIVRPSQTDDYIAAVKNFKQTCEANKVEMVWHSFSIEDNSFVHVIPVKGTASLEADLWTDLKSKIGQEAFDKLAEALKRNVESQIAWTATKMATHSYMSSVEGEPYRMLLYLYPLAGKEKELEDLFLEWKKYYEESKAAVTFHTYKIKYQEEDGYLIALPAKDPADMERKFAETRQVLGETEARLWKKQLSITKKYYWKRGYYSPDLSYSFSAIN